MQTNGESRDTKNHSYRRKYLLPPTRMSTTVVLVGAGAIGRHHLRSLTMVDAGWSVQVVETDVAAQALARESLRKERPLCEVTFVDRLEDCAPDPFLTVVATQATGRVSLIKSLLARGHRRFLIEKVVCQSAEEYRTLIESVSDAGALAWVNMPLRYSTFLREAQDLILGEQMVLGVVGDEWGLGTNAIHFADLFQALRGTWGVTFRRELLSPTLLPNKRASELCEFGGTLIGDDASGSVLSVSSLPFQGPTQTITITSDSASFFIDVVAGAGYRTGRVQGSYTHAVPYQEPYVSATTRMVVASILSDDTCLMPALGDLYEPHAELFRIFREHIGAVTGTIPAVCPIT